MADEESKKTTEKNEKEESEKVIKAVETKLNVYLMMYSFCCKQYVRVNCQVSVQELCMFSGDKKCVDGRRNG